MLIGVSYHCKILKFVQLILIESQLVGHQSVCIIFNIILITLIYSLHDVFTMKTSV